LNDAAAYGPFDGVNSNRRHKTSPVRRQRRAAAMAIARRATPKGRGAQRRVIRPGEPIFNAAAYGSLDGVNSNRRQKTSPVRQLCPRPSWTPTRFALAVLRKRLRSVGSAMRCAANSGESIQYLCPALGSRPARLCREESDLRDHSGIALGLLNHGKQAVIVRWVIRYPGSDDQPHADIAWSRHIAAPADDKNSVCSRLDSGVRKLDCH
jgi:hypothetical protein